MRHEYYDRDDLLAEPYPEAWEAYLRNNVAHYRLLSEEERARLRNDARVLVAEKNWEGCGGLRLTDEIKVTIAAQASLLLLGMTHDYFHRVLSILVYPSSFIIPGGEWMDDFGIGQPAGGQAVYRGPVIVAWDAVLKEGREPSWGHNLVIHEFAHQLDFLDGSVNGTPLLASDEQADRWHDVMTAAYTKLQRKLRRGRRTFLGPHASKNEGEFFAVASERFFRRPGRLRRQHPKVYEVLREYYGVEPVKWFAGKQGAA